MLRKDCVVKRLLTLFMFGVLGFGFVGCKEEIKDPISIAINPWPGYEFLYLAEKKGFFQELNANIELIQLGSLADAQRAYINGHADGLASTIIEAVQAEFLGGKPLNIVLVPDYSNGGDVIVANKDITSLEHLKGKKIGCEVSSLGIFVLQRALSKAGLQLSDVNVINVEQAHGEEYIKEGKIDAFVSYPPVSVDILKHEKYHTLFSSAEIPKEIIDTVALSEEVLKKNPDIPKKLKQGWQMALNYYHENTEDAVKIMAEREGITSDDFKAVLGDLKILDAENQKIIFSEPDKLQTAAVNVCNTLVHVQAIETNCNALPNIVYRGGY